MALADRDVVLLRGIELQLHYSGAEGEPHLAVYRHSANAPVDLEGATFTHRGREWRVGPNLHRAGDEESVVCIAMFHG